MRIVYLKISFLLAIICFFVFSYSTNAYSCGSDWVGYAEFGKLFCGGDGSPLDEKFYISEINIPAGGGYLEMWFSEQVAMDCGAPHFKMKLSLYEFPSCVMIESRTEEGSCSIRYKTFVPEGLYAVVGERLDQYSTYYCISVDFFYGIRLEPFDNGRFEDADGRGWAQTLFYKKPGEDWTVYIDPDEGYSVADVLVDGLSVGAVSSYTFTNIAANHTMTAKTCLNYDYYLDADGDGYGDPNNTKEACTLPSGYSENKLDCDDSDPLINPDGIEICNGKDDDCNGMIDDGVSYFYYRDADGDGYGDPGNSIQACSLPSGYVTNDLDCDDTDPNERPNQTWYKDADNDGYSDGTTNTSSCTRPVGYKVVSELIATSGDCDDTDQNQNPDAPEVCNGEDDDCDGKTDEGFDVDSDGYTTCAGDCDDSDPLINPDGIEICNGKDDDCNGMIDDGIGDFYYRDADGDGYGDPGNSIQACSLPSGYVTNDLDCDDTDPNERPNQTWYKDADNDGYSDGTTNTSSCTRPVGYKVVSELIATSGDCDDTDQNQNPDAPEVCNGEDDDCDGETDEFPCILDNPPEADAGSPQTVVEGETVTLDGSNSSDPDDDTISYQWTQIGGITATLSDPTAAMPTFVTPIVSPGGMILTFELVVKDDEDLQDSDQVTITVSDNGIGGFPDDVLTMTCSTGKHIGIKVESDLVSITAVDPDTIPDSSDKPDNLPYGLFDLLIKADAVGGTAKVTFYLEASAGNNDKWFKYKTSTGKWEDCSAYASFNAARDQVTLTLVDGGDGDDDGVADGWIVDPSGLNSSSSPSSSGGGGGGGGCFIATAADG